MKNSFTFFFLFLGVSIFSQKINSVKDLSIQQDEYRCEIFENNQKLRGKDFVSMKSFLVKVDNDENLYVEFQIGKRGKRIFLFLKVLPSYNICFKKEKNVDLYLYSGEVLRLKNDFQLNCEGIWVRELTSKELKKIRADTVQLIKLYTYQKDYDLYISEEQDLVLKKGLKCLEEYR